MPDLLAWGFAITLAAMTAVNPSRVHAQSLDGQTLAGAFVTMTRGARCPSTSSIAFSAQGEAIGRIDGIFDARGTIDLALGDNSRGPSVVAMSAQLDFNQKKVPGSLVWDPADPPLGITCDPLSMRIEGRLRYTITDPFDLRDDGLESGIAPPDSIFVWRDQLDAADVLRHLPVAILMHG